MALERTYVLNKREPDDSAPLPAVATVFLCQRVRSGHRQLLFRRPWIVGERRPLVQSVLRRNLGGTLHWWRSRELGTLRVLSSYDGLFPLLIQSIRRHNCARHLLHITPSLQMVAIFWMEAQAPRHSRPPDGFERI
jgi:hypothetical protein